MWARDDYFSVGLGAGACVRWKLEGFCECIMSIDCYCLRTVGIADGMRFAVFLYLLVLEPWVIPPDKIIPGIRGLNLSQILHIAAPPIPLPWVCVFTGLVLNSYFFLSFVSVEIMHQNGWNQWCSAPLQFSKISSGWVQGEAKHFKNGSLASFYHLPLYILGILNYQNS